MRPFAYYNIYRRRPNSQSTERFFWRWVLRWVFTLTLGGALGLSSGCRSDDQAADLGTGRANPATELAEPTSVNAQQPTAPKTAGQDLLSAGELTLLVLGDSISAAYGIRRENGWVAKLQTRLAQLSPAYQVVNASVSGETTQGGRARLNQALEQHNPDLVFIELGGNDALRGYPIESMQDNLIAMLRAVQEIGARAIVLGMDVPPNYGPRYRRSFRETFVTAAAATDACLVPFFLEGIPLEPGMMQDDGIHPTAIAQDTLLETGWKALQDCLGQSYPGLLRLP